MQTTVDKGCSPGEDNELSGTTLPPVKGVHQAEMTRSGGEDEPFWFLFLLLLVLKFRTFSGSLFCFNVLEVVF